MDDPLGLGVVNPSKQKLHERFHRRVERKRTNLREAPGRRAAATPRKVTPQAPPVRPPVPKNAQAKATKPWLGGCVMTLMVLGVLSAVGMFVAPLVWNIVRQEIVLNTGQKGFGQILRAKATSSKINEDTVYELTVDVQLGGSQRFSVELEQALSAQQARHLKPGAWAELRYDSSEPTSIVLVNVGIPDPRSEDSPLTFDTRAVPPRTSPDQIETDGEDDGDDEGIMGDRVIHAEERPANDGRALPPAIESETSVGATPPPTTKAPEPSTPPPNTPQSSTSDKPAPEREQPKPAPESQAPPAEISLVCRQASACCKIAGGGACGSFSAAGVDAKTCRKALRGFAKLAESAGKSCSGF